MAILVEMNADPDATTTDKPTTTTTEKPITTTTMPEFTTTTKAETCSLGEDLASVGDLTHYAQKPDGGNCDFPWAEMQGTHGYAHFAALPKLTTKQLIASKAVDQNSIKICGEFF